MTLGMLVGKDVAHGEPDILGLCGLVQELLALALFLTEPIPLTTVVHPRPLHVNGRGVFHEGRSFQGPEVPAVTTCAAVTLVGLLTIQYSTK